jgi:hypothetical protein
MQYNLKEKIEVTEEFLNELIDKSWQETENLQQQIANIDTSTNLGIKVARLLKNTCASYYVLIGCLETLIENPNGADQYITEPVTLQDTAETKAFDEPVIIEEEPDETLNLSAEPSEDFEPFEYFVDFDEPTGDPLSDEDLYS